MKKAAQNCPFRKGCGLYFSIQLKKDCGIGIMVLLKYHVDDN